MGNPLTFWIVAVGGLESRSWAKGFEQLGGDLVPGQVVLVGVEPDTRLGGMPEDPAGCPVHRVANGRTPGLAGAWNTGLIHVMRTAPDLSETFVLLLERTDDLDIDTLSRVQARRASIDAAGVGSGLFARMTSLLEAGLYNEHLTNRDGCDLWERLRQVGARLSDPPVGTRTGLSERLGRLWSGYPDDSPGVERARPMDPAGRSRFSLVVGVISADPRQLSRFLASLKHLTPIEQLDEITVMLVSNLGSDEVIREAMARHTPPGICQEFRPSEEYLPRFREGGFGVEPEEGGGLLPIVHTRTILQVFLAEYMSNRPRSVAWLLDDDMEFDQQVGRLVPWFPEFARAGVDVLLGSFDGDSPNPGSNGLRVQLVDLLWNLAWYRANPTRLTLAKTSRTNDYLRQLHSDYYYDLSRRHRGHLEEPFLFPPLPTESDAEAVVVRMLRAAPEMLKGASVTRPLITEVPCDPLAAAVPSVNRGGNTVVFKPEVFLNTPNVAVRVGGRDSRRSDMMWALINRYRHGVTIKAVGFPIRHLRDLSTSPELTPEKLVREVHGSAVYGGLSEFLANVGPHSFVFSEEEMTDISRRICRYRDERLLLMRENWYRIRGLLKALGEMVPTGELKSLLDPLTRWITEENWVAVEAGCRQLDPADIHGFLQSLAAASQATEGVADDSHR